ncbi:MAG TPA: ATPase [Synergistales bacterium]|nr:ATPase [Synergistales bacterium]HPC75206.1 ATPase [Synergistales bacterium]HRS48322.1 ATPase [Thermovirgaceae bacterium]HRU90448.1 ATPase [Thermovirgaceae bacterium]
MIRDMLFFGLWGLVGDRPRIIGKLHDLGVVHLHEEPMGFVSPETAAKMKILRGKTLGLLENLGWSEWGSIPREVLEEERALLSSSDETMIEAVEESLDSFSARLSGKARMKADLEIKLNSIKGALRTISHFETFIRDNARSGLEVSLWWAQKAGITEPVARIRKKVKEKNPLEKGEGVPYLLRVTTGGERVLAMAYPHEFREVVRKIFLSEQCVPWMLPGDYEGMTFREALPLMEAALEEIPGEINEIDRNLQAARREWGPKLGALYMILDEKVEEALVESGSETRGEVFRLSGWVPADEKAELTARLKAEFGERLFLRWREPQPGEWTEVPTSLKNPRYFRPFELFLKLMPVISYKGLDPTVLIGLFFPLFGGCMVGDMGYGLVIGSLGLWFRRKAGRPIMKDVGCILLYLAAWSIFWGAAYGEIFGDLGHRFFHLEPLWLERSQVVLPVMAFTVGLGFAHVFLGFLMGVVQGLRTGQRHLWLERLGNTVVFLALLSVMVQVKGWLPGRLFSVPVTLLVVGLVLLLAGGGMGGLVEALGSVGNVLSYVRIAAIGLSSAILAMVANSFVDSLGVTFFGVFMALAIHLLNFALAVAGSSLHSARLQYVEFLGKFHSGGGTLYKPFSRREPGLWKRH